MRGAKSGALVGLSAFQWSTWPTAGWRRGLEKRDSGQIRQLAKLGHESQLAKFGFFLGRVRFGPHAVRPNSAMQREEGGEEFAGSTRNNTSR